MQKHESRCDLCRVETSSGLIKFTGFLDVEHEVAAVNKLHHEEETILKYESEMILLDEVLDRKREQ